MDNVAPYTASPYLLVAVIAFVVLLVWLVYDG